MKKFFDELMSLDKATDGGKSVFLKIFFIAFIGFILTILLVFIVLGFDIKHNFSAAPDFSKLGDIGGFIGGVLNPILALLVLMVLLGTARLQKLELKHTRKALKKTAKAAKQANIENAFFQLLELVNKTTGDVSTNYEVGTFGNETATALGPEAFKKMEKEITKSIRNLWKKGLEGKIAPEHSADWTISKSLVLSDLSRNDKLLKLTDHCYNQTYKKNRASLGIYFRVLYNMLRFLSEKENDLPKSMYETYCKIVRAKLSDFELIIIFFNCITEVGAPMKKYVSDFQLFDNLPLDELHFVVSYNFDHSNPKNIMKDTINLLDLSRDFKLDSFGRNEDKVAEYLSKQPDTAPAS